MKKSKSSKKPFDFVDGRFLNRLFLFLAVLNVIVVFVFEVQRDPQIVEHLSTVVSNHVYIVTNYLAAADQETAAATNKALEISLPYSYFVSDGVPVAKFYGRYFSKGSPTSYGVIERVFPDRIQLRNGVYLKNSIQPIEVSENQNMIERLRAGNQNEIQKIQKRQDLDTSQVIEMLPDPTTLKHYYQAYD